MHSRASLIHTVECTLSDRKWGVNEQQLSVNELVADSVPPGHELIDPEMCYISSCKYKYKTSFSTQCQHPTRVI